MGSNWHAGDEELDGHLLEARRMMEEEQQKPKRRTKPGVGTKKKLL